jgi:hypothetical protein
MNLYNIIYIFHINRRHEKRKKQTKTKNVERHENRLSKLKYAYTSTPFYLNDTNTPNNQFGFNF